MPLLTEDEFRHILEAFSLDLPGRWLAECTVTICECRRELAFAKRRFSDRFEKGSGVSQRDAGKLLVRTEQGSRQNPSLRF